MENKLIMFGSMTPMMRARELLRRHGIRGITVRTPAHLRRGSCGYSLLVKRGFDEAVSLIKNENIKPIQNSPSRLPIRSGT